MKMRRSIKWRFILPFVFIIMGVVTVMLVLYTNQYRKMYYEDTRAMLTSEANLLASEIALLPDDGSDPQALADLINRYSENLNVRVTVIQPDGKVIAESDATAEMMVNHLNRPEVQQVVAGGIGYNVRYSTTLKTEMVYVAVGQSLNGDLATIVRFAKPLEIVNARLAMIRRSILISGLAAILLAALVTFFAAKQTTRPIVELTDAAKRITGGDYSKIPQPGADNEINDLTRAFSKMAVQIQDQLSTISGQNANLETIVDRLMDGLIIVRRDGKIELINRTARLMFGIDELDGKSGDFVKTMQQYQLVELWQKTVHDKKDQNMYIELKNQGKYLLGMSTFLGTPQEGTVLILLQDRTKNRDLEEMRQTFVSNVSHELRTPLTTMKALSETLQQYVRKDPDSAERFITLMDVEIDKLTQMVLELLELSRIESGRVEMVMINENVAELLKRPVERMRMQADRAGLDLRLDVPEGLPQIKVDAERMERVLINIIHNAIKYTQPGGVIALSAEQAENEIIIRVKDTGEGIDEKDLPRIFERFYKTDQARASGGTGLGLAIAKHIVEAHQGRIWVESQKGLGSVFSIAIKAV